jgi:hypothetical protein
VSRPESTFWQSIKPHLWGDVERIENVASKGTPDVNGCCAGVDYWLELKVADYKGEFSVKPEQKVWHRKRLLACGRVFMVVKFERLISIQRLDVKTMEYVEVFQMQPRYDWQKFMHVILHKQFDC